MILKGECVKPVFNSKKTAHNNLVFNLMEECYVMCW